MAQQVRLFLIDENEESERTLGEWLRGICEQESDNQAMGLDHMSGEDWEALLNDILEGIPSI